MAVSLESALMKSIELIKSFVEEYQAYKETDELKEKIDLYIEVLNDLRDKFTIINNNLYPQIVTEHKNAVSDIKLFNNDLARTNKDMTKILKWWKSITHSRFKKVFSITCPAFIDSPTKMLDEYNKLFEAVKELLKTVTSLTNNLFGITTGFTNAELQKSWLLCGKSYLHDITIPKKIFVEAITYLVEHTYNEFYELHENCIKNAIEQFVDKINICMGNAPDDYITTFQVKKFSDKINKSSTIIELLALEDIVVASNEVSESKNLPPPLEIKEKQVRASIMSCCAPISSVDAHTDEEFTDIPQLCKSLTFKESAERIDFNIEYIVHNSDTVTIPASSLTENGEVRYGSNWPSKPVIVYTVTKSLSKIRMKFVADDQGWGGTGHCSVRYQINEDEPVVMTFLHHNKYDSNKYSYDIVEKLVPEDKVTIYLVCPSWHGWTATIQDMCFQLYIDE